MTNTKDKKDKKKKKIGEEKGCIRDGLVKTGTKSKRVGQKIEPLLV